MFGRDNQLGQAGGEGLIGQTTTKYSNILVGLPIMIHTRRGKKNLFGLFSAYGGVQTKRG